jgi:hypothetical protein
MSTNINETTIVLQVFDDFLGANTAKNKLQDNGIESFLEDENVVGLNPLGGIELRIFEKDLDTAKQILASAD